MKIAWRIAVDLRIKIVTGGLRLAVFCVVRLVTSRGALWFVTSVFLCTLRFKNFLYVLKSVVLFSSLC